MTSTLELSHLERAAAEGTCPRCAREVPRDGLACAHCGADVSVDVLLGSAVTDERTRYRLARALVELLGTEFAAVSDALRAEQPLIAAGVSRRSADTVLEVLAPFALETLVAYAPVPSENPPTTSEATQTSSVVDVVASHARALADLVRRGARTRRVAFAVGGAFAATLAVVGYGAFAPSEAPAASAPADIEPVSSRERVRSAMASILLVRSGNSLGTGFCVETNRVLTNAHVVDGGGHTVRLRFHDGRETRGMVLTIDAPHDLALVRIDLPCPPLPIGDAGSVEAGDPILTLGHPRGLEFSVTRGIVSHPARNAEGVVLIQTDAPVNSGNSGGPMLDEQGRVVGIVTLKDASGEGLAFAVPINYAYAGTRPFIMRPYGLDTRTFDARDATARTTLGPPTDLGGLDLSGPVMHAARGDATRMEVVLVYFESPRAGFVVSFVIEDAAGIACAVPIQRSAVQTVASAELASRLPAELASVITSRASESIRVETHVLDTSGCAGTHQGAWLVVRGGAEGFDRMRIR